MAERTGRRWARVGIGVLVAASLAAGGCSSDDGDVTAGGSGTTAVAPMSFSAWVDEAEARCAALAVGPPPTEYVDATSEWQALADLIRPISELGVPDERSDEAQALVQAYAQMVLRLEEAIEAADDPEVADVALSRVDQAGIVGRRLAAALGITSCADEGDVAPLPAGLFEAFGDGSLLSQESLDDGIDGAEQADLAAALAEFGLGTDEAECMADELARESQRGAMVVVELQGAAVDRYFLAVEGCGAPVADPGAEPGAEPACGATSIDPAPGSGLETPEAALERTLGDDAMGPHQPIESFEPTGPVDETPASVTYEARSDEGDLLEAVTVEELPGDGWTTTEVLIGPC